MRSGKASAPPTGLFNRDMLLLWQGYAFSAVGNVLYGLAIGIWVYQKTGSTALMGVMTSIGYFASLFLQPLGGVIADRCDRRAVLVAADAARGVAMLWLAYFAWKNTLAVWQVLAVAAVAAVCNVTFNPASQSAMVALVPRRELLRAGALLNGTRTTINLAGNAVSGFLVVQFGVPLMILLNGVSFLLSALSELFLRIPPHQQRPARGSCGALMGELLGGLRYLKGQKGLEPMLLAGAAVNLFCGGFTGIVYVWCLEKGMSVPQYGIFLAAEGGAATAATLLLGLVPIAPKRRFAVMLAGGILQNVFYVAAMVVTGFGACTVLYAANAFFNAVTNMLLLPAVLQLTEESYRGRVIALFSACSDGGMALSTVAYGVLAQAFGVQPVALVGALLTLIPSVSYFTNRTLRRVLAAE